ncbi:methylmalonyl-CoA mutase [Algibacter amylolyticus]|uniref:Methylmalonyl-CoA mutase n=1 Tax=Algibacter amylolyticus TaxID=1608400 RepID=A0A5M7BCL7_9FLAO|nr:methylmalonyl-CoA mutase subunit beta [Algibacter amylolyticus]KAA5825121.1 methylmalonyl-CoA mutase [Algibacter amylolyticus]MBB5268771.1 methylmalonyl-CoA mutase [Algibacter amylolyticus]TSJ77615.1 methylmalonyl-CoA mutase [Algibacter amylolyticus]
MTKNLFDGFNSVSAKQWKQKIQFDLKGADYNDTLIWKTNEDIDVKPFYHAGDFEKLPNISNTKATQWKICQTIYVADIEKSNLNAIRSIEGGVEQINFIIASDAVSIKNLIQNIKLDAVTLQFELLFLSEAYTTQLQNLVPKAKIKLDCIGQLAKTGNWFKNLKDDLKTSESLISTTKALHINGSLYQNAGATMVQELAYTLAHTNEYLNSLEASKSDLSSLSVTFHVSVGTNYFFEIAKLRALRVLWKTLASEYQINLDCSIEVTPTKRNKTIYDYNTNMLRTTTESMSAVLGGANAICNLPYDYVYHKSNEFAQRIARNQLLILKNESYFDKVNNPSDGSYYIESLTEQLSEKALELFKNIEATGGFLKQLKLGTIQRKIKESAAKEQAQFDNGDIILLGTNKHPNAMDKMKNELELYPFVKIKPRKTLIEPIIENRLSEHLEKNRLKNEN